MSALSKWSSLFFFQGFSFLFRRVINRTTRRGSYTIQRKERKERVLFFSYSFSFLQHSLFYTVKYDKALCKAFFSRSLQLSTHHNHVFLPSSTYTTRSENPPFFSFAFLFYGKKKIMFLQNTSLPAIRYVWNGNSKIK